MENNNKGLNDSLENDTDEMSFTDKIIALFTEPFNLFESIKNYPPRNIDWLIPVFITIVIAIFSSMVQMNDVEIKHEIREKQLQGLQKMVEEGKLPAESYDQAIERMGDAAKYQIFFTLIGVPIGVFFQFFVIALIYWVIARLILRGDLVVYSHVLSVTGLISIIGILSLIVTLALSILHGRMNTGLNLALIAQPETKGPLLTLLKAIDPFTIWSLILTSIGLSKLTTTSFQKSVIAVFAFAVILLALSMLIGQFFPSFGG